MTVARFPVKRNGCEVQQELLRHNRRLGPIALPKPSDAQALLVGSDELAAGLRRRHPSWQVGIATFG